MCAGQGGSLSGRLRYHQIPKVITANTAATMIAEINFIIAVYL
jgi:hypothetical protein